MSRISMRLATCCLTAAYLLVATARADPAIKIDPEENVSAEFGQCLDRADVFVPDREDCEETELERIMAQTDRTYAEMLRRLPDARAATLRRLQKRWAGALRGRCLNDPVARESRGGSLEIEAFRGCLIYENSKRISWLRHYGRLDEESLADKASSRERGNTDIVRSGRAPGSGGR